MNEPTTLWNPSRVLGRALSALLACACMGLVGWIWFGEPAVDFGPWMLMETRQIAVPLHSGVLAIEIHDRQKGWTERVLVESDGLRVVRGIPVKEFSAGPEPDLDPERAAYFESRIGPLPGRTTLERATQLAHWVAGKAYRRTLVKRERPKRRPVLDGDGRVVLASIEGGDEFNCLSLATIYADAARAIGLRVRRIDLSVRFGSPYEGHSIVEVWSGLHGKWIVVDPTFCTTYEIDGVPASAIELHRVVERRQFDRISVVRAADAPGADPWTYPINPLLFFQTVLLKVDGHPWVVPTDPSPPVGPVGRGGFLQVSSSDPLSPTNADATTVSARVGRIGDRIAFQDLNGVLYVCLGDDLFSYGRFEVRVSLGSSHSFTPEIVPHDTTDDALCLGDDLIENERLVDEDGDRLPDGWEIDGVPARVETSASGGVTIESADLECELFLRIPKGVGVPLAAAARLRVDTGDVAFGLRKRRFHDGVLVGPTPPTTVSPILLAPQNHRARLRFIVAPHTRCEIDWVSLRRVRRLGECVARPADDVDPHPQR